MVFADSAGDEMTLDTRRLPIEECLRQLQRLLEREHHDFEAAEVPLLNILLPLPVESLI